MDNPFTHPPTNIESLLPVVDVNNTQQDYQSALGFLYSYRGSADTFASYRREIERLLQWSWLVAGESLIDLKRHHIEAFVEFCQKPPTNWIGTKTAPRFLDKQGQRVPNSEWRPFVVKVSKHAVKLGKTPDVKDYQLSQSGLQALFSILSSFYNYLVQEDYAEYNPVAALRQKSKYLRKKQGKAKIRRLSDLQWQYVIETAEKSADTDPNKHERTLFIMTALYAMYLRISELSANERWTPEMGDFHLDTNGNWWFTTVGKGNKERDISVSDDMLSALKRYRKFLVLPSLPMPAEKTPLISKQNTKGPISSTRHIRTIVQNCFDAAVLQLREDGFQEDADMLCEATVHWLRHTGISDDIKVRPAKHVSYDAGHGSIVVTDRYIDIDLRERHASKKKRKIKED